MESWGAFGVNVAVVGLFISFWVNVGGWFERKPRIVRNSAFGLIMGAAAIASVLNAVPLQPGILLDLRNSVLCCAGMFGGPVAALIACVMTAAARLIIGGAGAPYAVGAILLSGGLGAAAWAVLRRPPDIRHVAIMALFSGAFLWVMLMLPTAAGAVSTLHGHIGSVALFTAGTTFLVGLGLMQAERMVMERDLLRATLLQAPDFVYVKNERHQIIAASQGVAEFNGFSSPSEMLGLTDRELTSPDRAAMLLAQEERILLTGEPVKGLEETVFIRGKERTFTTTKIPLHSADGKVVGIAGVTRDVTAHREMEQELREGRDLLDMVTAQMSDGLALFTADGTLRYCNELYRSMFPVTGELRRPGAKLRDILWTVVETGEQLNLPDDKAAWVEGIMEGLKDGSEEQVRFADGTWVQLRSRPTPHGETVVVATDITAMKSTEAELISMTAQLRVLATTDGLTGLMNRRSFDDALDNKLAATQAGGQPISLMMIDVDHFKAFNDLYGHLAGDACLKLVGQTVAQALRGMDVVARFGGEEFVAILPDATDDQAYQVATRIQSALAECRIAHSGSSTGLVTVSIGIAGYPSDTRARSASQLLARADEALYVAKDAGRDRIMGWRRRIAPASVA